MAKFISYRTRQHSDIDPDGPNLRAVGEIDGRKFFVAMFITEELMNDKEALDRIVRETVESMTEEEITG
jgi:hypothetical protein